MAIGPQEAIIKQHLGALSTTTTYSVWSNDTGETWTLAHGTFNQLGAITGSDTNYYDFDLHLVTSAGVHTTDMATLDYTSGTDHVAFVGDEFTKSATPANLVIDDGEGIEVTATKHGSASNLSADAQVTIHLLKGTGAGQ